MERILTPDERIRRAEEIYYRKRIQTKGRDIARVSVSEKPNFSLLKKMFLQIAICILIYCMLYLVQTTDYVFSGDVLGKTKEILSYDTDFNKIYFEINSYIKKESDENIENEIKPEENENNIEENKEEEINIVESVPEDGGQGGLEAVIEEDISNLSQMEIDAREITKVYVLDIPLRGVITSRFGNRNPTTPTVPKYHTGIDIAVNEGTTFVASMDGTVSLVSGVGDYRKPHKNIKWRCNDFICSLQSNIC